MKFNIHFNGERVGFIISENDLVLFCSHWHWLPAMLRAGILKHDGVDCGSAMPPNIKLANLETLHETITDR